MDSGHVTLETLLEPGVSLDEVAEVVPLGRVNKHGLDVDRRESLLAGPGELRAGPRLEGAKVGADDGARGDDVFGLGRDLDGELGGRERVSAG